MNQKVYIAFNTTFFKTEVLVEANSFGWSLVGVIHSAS